MTYTVVEDWASSRIEVLRWLLEYETLEGRHFNDDRLGLILDRLEGDNLEAFHRDYNSALLQTYDLTANRIVRLDSVKAQSRGQESDLLGIAHKQSNKRDDLHSVKAMVVAVDPLALPLSTLVVKGSRVDDQLYCPVIEQAWQEGLPTKNMLFVGDTKLGNMANWAFIAQSGNYYLSPLSLKQFSEKDLDNALDWIDQSNAELVPFYSYELEEGELPDETRQIRAKCVELAPLTKNTGDYTWKHRLLAVCNEEMRAKQQANLIDRERKAKEELEERFTLRQGRKRIGSEQEAMTIANQVLAKYKLHNLATITISTYTPPTQDTSNNTKTSKTRERLVATLHMNQLALQAANRRAGWSVYATNAQEEEFSTYEMLCIYRQQFRIEQQFHNLLNKSTVLMPILLHKSNRIKGLIKVLILGLQFITILQHRLRQGMDLQKKTHLTGLIPGNSGRRVTKPTAALAQRAFCSINLVIMENPDRTKAFHINGIKDIHILILDLMRIDKICLSYLRPTTEVDLFCPK